MDPLNNDSDSLKTGANEAGNGISDDMEDLDGDGLINCMELLVGSDTLSDDSDGDGLPDLFEVEISRTSPVLVDTDGDNVSDALETRNSDNVSHAYIKPITNDTWNIGWEDIAGGGDIDYNDIVLNVTFAKPTNDTDMDGLPDVVEEHGFMDAQGHVYHTYSDEGDTDGDGLLDGDEAGTPISNENCQYYYNIKSDPTDSDTDDDGLGDGEELHGHEIRVADTHEMGIGYTNAFFGLDAYDYLTSVLVKSDPLKRDSDDDGVDDNIESLWGTNPDDPDTDNDEINDLLDMGTPENGRLDDPTVFDVNPPQFKMHYVWTNRPPLTLIEDYTVSYTVSDMGALKSADLMKDGFTRVSHTYDHSVIERTEQDFFHTDGEAPLDALRSSVLSVKAVDQHDNAATYEVYRQYAVYESDCCHTYR